MKDEAFKFMQARQLSLNNAVDGSTYMVDFDPATLCARCDKALEPPHRYNVGTVAVCDTCREALTPEHFVRSHRTYYRWSSDEGWIIKAESPPVSKEIPTL